MKRTFLPCVAVLAAGTLASCDPGAALGRRSGSPAIPSAWSDIRVSSAFIAKGQYGRWRVRSMSPRYITIHATENFSASGTAHAHARMLQTGALRARKNSLGYLSWHFTVDDHSIYQSLPCNEQGQHADYEGPGNRSSIGIEMCENRGGSREKTLDRTAKLTAVLMKQYGIPLGHVVPHQHWRMVRYVDGRDLGHKTCPHFLVRKGESDPAWQAFLGRVQAYRDQLDGAGGTYKHLVISAPTPTFGQVAHVTKPAAPGDALDASLSANQPAGTNTVHVQGSGCGNPTSSTPTGYRDYGSIGHYLISSSIP